MYVFLRVLFSSIKFREVFNEACYSNKVYVFINKHIAERKKKEATFIRKEITCSSDLNLWKGQQNK